jgi:hypothetical protein
LKGKEERKEREGLGSRGGGKGKEIEGRVGKEKYGQERRGRGG